ncbi:MAG: D-glycero-beta-D-manno-heptose 1-phosphate adenylyltransferase [Thermomicrobia bacterium]|nr:D-glycero-beta-D-manno-heptose 1-phosphate adenylyltransferase [Thermomicrobia bacterium]
MLHLIDAFAEARILVIGDAMLDAYLVGTANRVCREAPVPVVALAERQDVPGGAANTAANVASLDGNVTFLSVVGDDAEGGRLRDALATCGVDCGAVHTEHNRRTLAKHRVVAGSQVLVRFDQGDMSPMSPCTEQAVIDHLIRHYARYDAVIVSDYAYGVLTPRVIETLAAAQARSPHPLIVDAKNLPAYRLVGVTAIKPNYDDAVRLLSLPPMNGPARTRQIEAHGERLLDLTGARIAAVTLDMDGALVIERGCPPHHIPARPRVHARAIGAGDTFVGALALALAAGGDACTAAEVAAAAAAIAVESEGTTACTLAALRERVIGPSKHGDDLVSLVARVERLRAAGKRIVFTNGCFDILHRGHVTLLAAARALGDALIVGVNTDASVARLKGPHRPINPLDDRMAVLAALAAVDWVIPFAEETPERLIRALRPEIFVKGGDYTKGALPEASLVESLGGRVRILPFTPDRSTTRVIEHIRLGADMPPGVLHTDFAITAAEG